MQDKIIQYLLPIICVVLLALAAALGGAGFGWSRGVASEQAKLSKERVAMANREREILAAEAEWKGKVDAQNAKFIEAASGLAAARQYIDQISSDTKAEIRVVASPVRQCLAPATARLLDRRIAQANERLAATRDPGVLVAAATASAPVTAPGLDDRNIAFPDGISEQDIAEYLNDIRSDYEKGSRQHDALIEKLRASPLIVVVPDNRSL